MVLMNSRKTKSPSWKLGDAQDRQTMMMTTAPVKDLSTEVSTFRLRLGLNDWNLPEDSGLVDHGQEP